MNVGDHVIYHDEKGNPHHALVTVVWSNWESPCINLLYVSPNEAEQDQYGRQIKRESSVSHASHLPTHGRYWRRVDEPINQQALAASE